MADSQGGAVSASQNASRPYFTQKVRLNSLHAQQVFDRGFDIGANAIFSLSIILRVIGTDEQAQGIEGIVDGRINKQLEDLRAETTRLETLAEANGIEFSGINYSNPKDVEARITSPRAVRYIGLIREFDALAAKFDTLWLSGVIPDGTYSRNIYEWKRRLIKLANGIRSIAGQAMVAARKKQQAGTSDAEAVHAADLDDAAKVLGETQAEDAEVEDGGDMAPSPVVA
ncbi:MAG: hypothetical protein Q8M09_14945 [Pseudomonadota bacterium]|nr:hypothetical protein [Pseudomonadota bacterium]MDP1905521.1 hypothetical protein [Pseudomonadota bacterium]